MVEIVSDAREALLPFLVSARWFGGKGREVTLGSVHRLGVLPGTDPTVALDVVEVRYADQPEAELYQVPLAFYSAPVDRLGHALVGLWEDPELGRAHVYDAVHDRDAMARWLAAFAQAAPQGSRREGSLTLGELTFRRLPGHDLDTDAHSALFAGEQSNSSVRYGEDSMMKVFRRLTPGVNPDVEIHEALTRAGSEHIAQLYGWLEAPAPGADGETLHLAMLQQFLRTASDGWDLARASVRDLVAEADLRASEVGGDFEAESARLGEAVGEVHHSLHALGVHSADTSVLAEQMTQRLRDALAVVPPLAEHEERLLAVFERLAALGEQPVQRIHGDLHLGQTLRTVRGWKVVDFEGEPAKPLAERVLPDSVWRDVAGMMRSFDYAAHVVERALGEDDPQSARQLAYRASEWAARNGGAFLAAYAGRTLTSAEQALLAAYVADKAVYETVYEMRNRPTWVDIPLAAIARIGAS